MNECIRPDCQKEGKEVFTVQEVGYFGGLRRVVGEILWLCREDSRIPRQAFNGEIPVPDWMKNESPLKDVE